MMVVGMPNVGKSSLINALRRNFLRKGELFSMSPTHDCGAPWKVLLHIQGRQLQSASFPVLPELS